MLILENTQARQSPVLALSCAKRPPPFFSPQVPGMEPLASLPADIKYLFPLWHGGPLGIPHPLNRPQTMLSDQLVSAWANFARTGNPNGSGNNPWPRYTALADPPPWLLQYLPGLSALTDARYAALRDCDFW